jgi:hypothetical protein
MYPWDRNGVGTYRRENHIWHTMYSKWTINLIARRFYDTYLTKYINIHTHTDWFHNFLDKGKLLVILYGLIN